MMASETVPEWQDGDDSSLADDFTNLFDEPEAACSGGAITNKTSTEASCQSSTPSWSLQGTQAVKPCDATMDSINTPQCPSSSNSAPGQGFVNVYLIVDPVTQQVYCPKQLLVYNSGEKTQAAMFGPTSLSSFPKDTIQSLANQVTRQRVEQVIVPGTNSRSFANNFIPIKQLITYNSGEKTQTAMFGPTSLNSLPNDTIRNIVNQVTKQPAEQVIAPDTNSRSIANRFIPIAPPSPTTTTQVMSYPDSVSSWIVSSSKTVESEGQSDMPPVIQAPLRSLSAYNFFFRDERDHIVHGGPMELNPAKQHHLLQEHWCRDRTKKRPHRKTHGKIDFTSLSKLISKRWKELPEDSRAFYRQVASLDWERYQAELSEQKISNAAPNATPNEAPSGSSDFIAIPHKPQDIHTLCSAGLTT
jgi:hypothetical protein